MWTIIKLVFTYGLVVFISTIMAFIALLIINGIASVIGKYVFKTEVEFIFDKPTFSGPEYLAISGLTMWIAAKFVAGWFDIVQDWRLVLACCAIGIYTFFYGNQPGDGLANIVVTLIVAGILTWGFGYSLF